MKAPYLMEVVVALLYHKNEANCKKEKVNHGNFKGSHGI